MGKKRGAAQRAWNLLRMTLIWARKGGALKRWWPMLELRNLVTKHLKTLAHAHRHGCSADGYLFRYGERELSFDKTPILHVKMHRPASVRSLLSCITPQIDFDYDFHGDDDLEGGSYGYGEHYLGGGTEEYGDEVAETEEEEEEEEEEEIDERAEKFIAKFYEQMKLQRQISYLQYYKESNNEDQ